MDIEELKAQVYAAPEHFKTRQHIWQRCIAALEPGDTCGEFGVWHGTSVNYLAAARPDNEFHGFDSFEGLPEAWIAGHPKGHFKLDASKLKFQPNVTIHRGLFTETIPKFEAEHADSAARLKLIHLDCDLGTSAAHVLRALAERIMHNKCLLLFDEFYNYPGYEVHEFRAFLQFANLLNFPFRVIGRNVNHQQVLIQIL